MNKQEFLDRLRMALSGQVSAGQVEENVAYYSEYINSQVRMGQTEEKVLGSLGDPRLIAKSIVSANTVETTDSTGRFGREYDAGDETYYAESRQQQYPKVVHINGWLGLLVVIGLAVIIIGAICSLITLVFPLIMLGGIMYFLVKLFRDWLN